MNPTVVANISSKNHLGTILALAIPVINVLATIAIGHFQGGMLNPGTLRAIIVFGLIFVFFAKGLPADRILNSTYFLIFFLLISTLLSMNLGESLYVYLRFVIASIMFVIGFVAIKDRAGLLYLSRVVIAILGIKVLYIALANYLYFGTSDYLDDSFFFGETGVNITKEMVVAVFVAPVFLLLEKNNTYKLTGMVLLLIALVIILIGLKRSAILSVTAGGIVYLITSPRKLRSLRIALFALSVLFAFSAYYMDLVSERYIARSEKVSMAYGELNEEEGRVVEIKIVWNEFLKKNPLRQLIGSGPFLIREDYFGLKRIIHIDYLNLLDGAGILGLFAFLWVYFAIARRIFFVSGKIKHSPFIQELKAVGLALIVIQLVMGIAGSVTGIGLRGLILLYLGAICGVMQSEYKKYRITQVQSAL